MFIFKWIYILISLFVCRQDSDCLEVDPRWGYQLRLPPEASVRTLALHQRRCALVRRQLRSVRFLGSDSASVGFGCRQDHSPLRGTHQGGISFQVIENVFQAQGLELKLIWIIFPLTPNGIGAATYRVRLGLVRQSPIPIKYVAPMRGRISGWHLYVFCVFYAWVNVLLRESLS